MASTSRNTTFSCFSSLLITFLVIPTSPAQEIPQKKSSTSLEKAEIKWIGQWPSDESKLQEKKDSKKQVLNFIIGKKKIILKRPVSVLASNQHSFWILDQGNNAVFQVDGDVGKIPHFIDKKNDNYTSLVGICKFHDKEILFTDSRSNKIFLVNTEKKECKVLNDTLKLNKPTGIAYSLLNKEIWVIETGTHRIVVLNEKGEIKKTIGSRGNANGEFNFPTHIWIDKKGNAYVTDAMNFRIQVFNNKGDVVSVFGSSGDKPGYFSSPKGVATDSYGNIYVADAMFHVVQVFDINGNFLYTFGSQGFDKGQFWMPSGMYIDDNDKIYIADSYNSRIQIFQLITGK